MQAIGKIFAKIKADYYNEEEYVHLNMDQKQQLFA